MRRKYGRLTVLGSAKTKNQKKHYRCRCVCGVEIVVESWNLTSGNTQSCGCLQKERASAANTTHGESGSLAWKTWWSMLQRCNDPKSKAYSEYGGIGIRVCDRWEAFECFLADMGPRPSQSYSIDRLDGAGNYEPGNCRWATPTEQARNRKSCRLLTLEGETMSMIEWSERTGISCSAIKGRLKRGWGVADTLSTPMSDGSHSRKRRFKVAV